MCIAIRKNVLQYILETKILQYTGKPIISALVTLLPSKNIFIELHLFAFWASQDLHMHGQLYFIFQMKTKKYTSTSI